MYNLSRTFTADALPWILVENNMPSQCREMFQRLLQGRTWQEVWGVGRTNRPLALKQEIDQVLSVQFLFELLDLFERLRQNVLRLALLGYLHVRSTAHGRSWIRRILLMTQVAGPRKMPPIPRNWWPKEVNDNPEPRIQFLIQIPFAAERPARKRPYRDPHGRIRAPRWSSHSPSLSPDR